MRPCSVSSVGLGLLLALCLLAGRAESAALPLDQCGENFFICLDGEGCVPPEARCDGTPDCGDSTDEYKCGTEAEDMELPQDEPRVIEEHFTEECMLPRYRCDGTPDCADSADEKNCSTPYASSNVTRPVLVTEDCNEDEHRCMDGTCISKERLCDGPRDCHDGSDEASGCNKPKDPVGETSQSISASMDEGISAEILARRYDVGNCSHTEYRCSDGQCVPLSILCDGRKDCKDGTDETVACPDVTDGCKGGYMCPKSQRCIPHEWLCDGTYDCPDKSDENECVPEKCRKMEGEERESCWRRELHDLEVQELELRQKLVKEKLQRVEAAVSADKALAHEAMRTAELEREAAQNKVIQDAEIYKLKLQALQQSMNGVMAPMGTPANIIINPSEAISVTEAAA